MLKDPKIGEDIVLFLIKLSFGKVDPQGYTIDYYILE